jgi:hypothetical protein
MDEIYGLIQNTVSSNVATTDFPIIFKGKLTHEVTKLFATMAESIMDKKNADPKVTRKVYHVTVEFLQNITKHSDDQENGNGKEGNGMFIIGEKENSFYVVTANKVNGDKVEKLTNRLEELNQMNPEELKALFKKQMKEGRIDNKGGAGLGLIDLIRKTGSKLEYNFLPLNNGSKFFINMIKIPYQK